MIPEKLAVLDIACLVFAALVGLPQLVVALRRSLPRNLRLLALALGLSGVAAGAAGALHWAGAAPALRPALLGLSAALAIGWLLGVLSLARHNTTM